MEHKIQSPVKLFASALLAAGLVLHVAFNYSDLWLGVLFYGAFTFLWLLQNATWRQYAAQTKTRWLSILVQLLLCAGCAAVAKGPGAAFLFYLLALETSLSHAPLPSGILCAAALGVLLALSPGRPETAVLHAAVFAAVYLMAHAVKNERAVGKAMAKDVSQLRGDEKRLVEHNLQIRRLNESLEETAKLKERNRIAKGIHDTLGHTLTAVIVQLSAAQQVIGTDPERAAESMRNAREQAKKGLDSVRGTIHQLEYSGLSFVEKLKQAMGDAMESLQVKILPVIDAGLDPDEETQQALLSCLKEGLTNGVRHGGASAFVFKLERKDGCLALYLEDNGIGCVNCQKGYGLASMEQMAEQSGGAFEAAGLPDEGFYLKVTLPDKGREDAPCRS